MEDHDLMLAFSWARVELMYVAALEQALVPAGGAPVTGVEPHPTMPGWIADLSQFDGTILGAHIPFTSRNAALEAERRWLHVHLRI